VSSAEDLTPGVPPPEPTQVGRYRLGVCIGRGSYGAVHRAHDPQLDRDVALELLSSRRDDEDMTRLAREARAIADARLGHGREADALHWAAMAYKVIDRVDPDTPNAAAIVRRSRSERSAPRADRCVSRVDLIDGSLH
jgi:serine/threonine protein kinase